MICGGNVALGQLSPIRPVFMGESPPVRRPRGIALFNGEIS